MLEESNFDKSTRRQHIRNVITQIENENDNPFDEPVMSAVSFEIYKILPAFLKKKVTCMNNPED